MEFKIQQFDNAQVQCSPDGSILFFFQEVVGVVTAARWEFRSQVPSVVYWAVYSEKTLMDVFVCDGHLIPQQCWLDKIDTQWRRLANDPVSEREQYLEPEYVKGE